ncbi:hypothetical protein [Leptospira sp. GIMC2001]|uniref:hypothetical protein n=1 Tax=Leptospira sp. GIMC2001 TaxID=1513297 RepID=UPI00234B938E|nr:hypothetical protein [Leptospira sp. GIMC2001]WCL50797.1 hypothetical protein O4O04_08290 [Leptospira sp. GIMC2001]
MEEINRFIDKSSNIIANKGLTEENLGLIASDLRILALKSKYWLDNYKMAKHSEELLYPIISHRKSGIALYLVSDAPGVKSPPHSHQTWAIIAGISGIELNHFYKLIDGNEKKVQKISSILVNRGDVIVMKNFEIHSTEVIGSIPSFHLHLYGQNLELLPEFSERTFLSY